MDKLEFLKMLFDGYVACYRKFGWHRTSNYSDMTQFELDHFAKLGEGLGFLSRREMNWNYPRDLCWCRHDSEATVYFERENEDSRCEHTIEKMVNPENVASVPYLVQVFGWLRPSTYESAKAMLLESLPKDKANLMIAWVANGKDSDDFKVKAWAYDGSRHYERVAEAKVDKGGYWYLYFEPGTNWL